MHDVLAHRISLLCLHAGALEFRADAPPDEVARAAGVIRDTAHEALEDLREVIGVLREGATATTPERPQPTLADLPALVDESRAAGMQVRYDWHLPEPARPCRRRRPDRLPDRAGGPHQRAQARARRGGRRDGRGAPRAKG